MTLSDQWRDISEAPNASEQMMRAVRSYREDRRFMAMVNSCAHRAKTEFGTVNPDYADSQAMIVALHAAALMLDAIYENDAELNGLRRENAYYKARLLTISNLIPPPPQSEGDPKS